MVGGKKTRIGVAAAIAAATTFALAGSASGSGVYDVCSAGPPFCGWTLTAAVTDAIATPGPDTLQLAPGTYVVDSVFLEGTYEPITIKGMGTHASEVVITSTTRDVVTERATTRAQPDTLENLTVSSGAFDGIAQQNGTLALQDVVVKNNAGTGVSLSGGTVTIVRSTITGNTGAGISEGSSLLTVQNSTIEGNLGDGVVTDPAAGSASTHLANDTIALNHGFGLRNAMTVLDTVAAGNVAGDCNRTPGIRGGPVSSGFNISGDFSCGNFFTGVADQVPTFPATIDVRLGPLLDNGGLTPTMALDVGSPAIDAGGNPCQGADQRGFARTDGSCDIGSYEVGAHATVSATTSTVGTSASSVPADGASAATITVTLKDAAGNPVSGETVSLSPGAGSSVVSGGSGPSNASGVVTFTVHDSTAEAVTYTAEDTTQTVFVAATALVTFVTPAPTPTTASPAQPSPAPSPVAPVPVVLPPFASFTDTPTDPVAGTAVTFTAVAGTADGSPIASYEWDFGDGGSATGQIASHAFQSAGGFLVTLRVVDAEGQATVVSQAVRIARPAAPPQPTIVISFSPASPAPGQVVHFDALISNAGGVSPSAVTWHFAGLGASIHGNPVAHAFPDPGDVRVTVDVGGTPLHAATTVRVRRTETDTVSSIRSTFTTSASTVTGTYVKGDGSVRMTVALRTSGNQLVTQRKLVEITGTDGSSSVAQTTGGIARFTITPDVGAQAVTYTARDKTDGIGLTSQRTVTYLLTTPAGFQLVGGQLVKTLSSIDVFGNSVTGVALYVEIGYVHAGFADLLARTYVDIDSHLPPSGPRYVGGLGYDVMVYWYTPPSTPFNYGVADAVVGHAHLSFAYFRPNGQPARFASLDDFVSWVIGFRSQL